MCWLYIIVVTCWIVGLILHRIEWCLEPLYESWWKYDRMLTLCDVSWQNVAHYNLGLLSLVWPNTTQHTVMVARGKRSALVCILYMHIYFMYIYIWTLSEFISWHTDTFCLRMYDRLIMMMDLSRATLMEHMRQSELSSLVGLRFYFSGTVHWMQLSIWAVYSSICMVVSKKL